MKINCANVIFISTHSHVRKGAKGTLYFSVCMSRGFNTEWFRPLMVVLKRKGDIFKKEKAIIESHMLYDDMMKHTDIPVDYDKLLTKHDLQGTLLWELHRTEEDKNCVETINRFGRLNCYTNIQLLTSSDQAGHLDDYLHGCLTKMSEMRLEGVASTILAAMIHI